MRFTGGEELMSCFSVIGKMLHCVCEVNGEAYGIALSLSDSRCNCFLDSVTFTLMGGGALYFR